ncbi:MAG: hypothetical protein GW875_00165 [Deltaproteobacteria bacterium]|nr:hypothetical protein [Deltaproteobacteria bacterium]NCP02938.1 hypothetical protein [Deltaproteobacteria bacterium]
MYYPILGYIVPNMGNTDRKTFSISDALFTKTQQQLLRLLFGQPEKSFYSKELVDRADKADKEPTENTRITSFSG